MTIFGYARVSSEQQSLDIQLAALRAAGCETIRAEKMSGTTRQGRKELDALLKEVVAGDTIVITRIDRLCRSIVDLMTIVDDLNARGITLRATEQAIDPTTPAGAAFIGMIGIFAAFETAIRAERQKEGILKAKSVGRYLGRPVKLDAATIRALHDQGADVIAICSRTGASRASVYRLINPSS